MQIPTLGRLVLYGVDESERGNNNGGRWAPAVITRVHSNECVNLKVLCDGSIDLWKTSVILGDEGAVGPAPNTWIWPPRV